jgi:hypothetical protein
MVGYIVYTNTRSRDICDVYYNKHARALHLESNTFIYNISMIFIHNALSGYVIENHI